MSEELKTLHEALQDEQQVDIKGIHFYVGKIASQPVVLVQSGIGKVQAGITAAIMIVHFDLKVVINSGSAGGIGSGLSVGDLVVSTGTAYHDVDVTTSGYKYGQLPNQPLIFKASPKWANLVVNASQAVGLTAKKGLIVSGDQFVASDKRIKEILNHFPDTLACEMEGAAIGQVAHQFKTPYVVIRAMSDVGNGDAEMSFDKFIIKAGKQSAQMLLNLCKALN
ncbi:5'-methylthioadenosine/adenosylhomocysteine nucleosidase [Acetilactobacillus jinshanensis]|nr:5'-methylthioadenosine/adenosylhomocysteine nucleosidase [Acetilactobacillus jinshanensis]